MLIRELDILGKQYVVVSVERDSKDDYGECFADQCRIEIATFQCDEQRCDTLLHEVLHAIDHEMDCHMSEPQIRRMATGLLAVLRHNADMVNYLMGASGR